MQSASQNRGAFIQQHIAGLRALTNRLLECGLLAKESRVAGSACYVSPALGCVWQAAPYKHCLPAVHYVHVCGS